MPTLSRITIFLCLLVTPLLGDDQPPHKDWRQFILNDIDFIHHAYETQYAPVNWKRDYLDCDFNAAVLTAKEKVLGMKKYSAKDTHTILRNMMRTLKDYHVSIHFISTEFASLPFQVKEAEGKYYFAFIDYDHPNVGYDFPFEVGDELLMFDGEPIDKVVTALRKRTAANHVPTDKALAAMTLTRRFGLRADRVPSGVATLIGRKAGETTKVHGSIPWDYYPEWVKTPQRMHILPKEASQFTSTEKWFSGAKCKNPELIFNKDLFACVDCLSEMEYTEASNKCAMGARESFLPYLGEVLWECDDDCPFHSYIFETPSGVTGGYVRIPSYIPEDADYNVETLSKTLKKMQKQIDVLVIDQNNNPGGSLFYLYGLVHALADKPMKLPKQRIMITQEDILMCWLMILECEGIDDDEEAREIIGESIHGYPVNKRVADQIVSYCYEVIQEWAEGRRFTKPLHLFGIDEIRPSKSKFKKPILLLVNELDFSGGDFFPAILQDNKKAILMGTRTAGAGGYIKRVMFPNLSGIMGFILTGSLAERVNSEVIENLGVTPEIEYEMTANDLEFDYVIYKREVVSALESMVKKK